jgi:hypothetical protein
MPRAPSGCLRAEAPRLMVSLALGRSPCSTWIPQPFDCLRLSRITLHFLTGMGWCADERGHHTAKRLKTRVNESRPITDNTLTSPPTHALDSGSKSPHLIRVDTLLGLCHQAAHQVLHHGHAGGSTYLQLRDILRVNPDSFSADSNGPYNDSAGRCHLLEFCRLSSSAAWRGPLASAVMYGRVLSVSIRVDTRSWPFQRSRSRCNAWRSCAVRYPDPF